MLSTISADSSSDEILKYLFKYSVYFVGVYFLIIEEIPIIPRIRIINPTIMAAGKIFFFMCGNPFLIKIT